MASCLTRLRTTRPAGLNGLASQLFTDPAVVQDLRYTYDPAGNITRIEDAALKTFLHNNEPVQPVCAYTYDAIYRLLEAQGREHIGQTAHDFNPPDGNRRDFDFIGLADFIAHPNDMQAMRNYTERYEYDSVGNFQFMRHSANGGSWTRRYEYAAASLIEPLQQSNRLTKTTVGNGTNFDETYTYTDAQGKDVHGCITAINSMKMVWDSKDQLQQVDLGGGGVAYYVYDGGGQRVRKVIETQNGTRQHERLYLGGFEIYREYNGSGTAVKLERGTLHIMDDKQHIALVETKTVENQSAIHNPQSTIRFQLGNHLGSASLELDASAGLISYEEYHPYGTTSFQTRSSAAEVSLKRYRYTGMERDEETGFSYHSARYYAPWLGKWISPDPIGLSKDGTNVYSYVRNNPINYVDPSGLEGEEKKGAFQWAKDKDENDVRHQRLNNLRKILQDHGFSRGDITDILEKFGDDKILRHYGYTAPGRAENTVLSFSPRVIDAIDRYDAEWRQINGTAGQSIRELTDADIKAQKEAQRKIKEIQRALRTFGNIVGGLGGTIGYAIGGDVGSDIGAAIDNVVVAAHATSAARGARPVLQAPRAEVTIPTKLQGSLSAADLHAAAGGPPKFRDYNPTVALNTAEGTTLYARGPTKQLTPNQKNMAQSSPGVIAETRRDDKVGKTKVPKDERIHPDIAVLVRAHFLRLTPTELSVSGRPFCPSCVAIIQSFGGVVIAPGYRAVFFRPWL